MFTLYPFSVYIAIVFYLSLSGNITQNRMTGKTGTSDAYKYIKARHRDEAFDTDRIINTMMNIEREPNRVKKEFTDTVSVIVKISGKSLRSLERSCSLLKLPEEIQNAIREGAIGVSQGYIFAANLDHPNLMDIFQEAVGEGFTNAGLEKELKKGRKPATTAGVKKRPFSLYRRSVQSMRTGIEEQVPPGPSRIPWMNRSRESRKSGSTQCGSWNFGSFTRAGL